VRRRSDKKDHAGPGTRGVWAGEDGKHWERATQIPQRGIGRKYGHTVDALRGNPLGIRNEHVIHRLWKAFTKPTKWGHYAARLAALKIGKSFEIAGKSGRSGKVIEICTQAKKSA
jgi:hypothetical protein